MSNNLHRYGFSPRVVEPWGTGRNGVLVVAEAPGEHEDRTGEPLHPDAPAGGLLDRLLRRAGQQRAEFKLTNTCWQRPPKNFLEGAPWEREAIDAYREHNLRLMEEMQPKCLLLLGGVALRAFTDLGGEGCGITQVRGYALQTPYGPAVATYHPSYLVRGQAHLSGVFIHDVLRCLQIAQGGLHRRPLNFLTHPSLEQLLAFERDYNPQRHALTYDIETPESAYLDEETVEDRIGEISGTIVRMSLCYDAPSGVAVSFPWQEPYVAVAKRMLASYGPKRGHNSRLFDDPRLRANGCQLNGRLYDTMDAWSHLQKGLPRGLGFVAPFYCDLEPWKHLAHSQEEFYSCCDAYAQQCVGDGIERDLRSAGLWDNYERHVVDALEVLSKAARTGLPYNPERAKEFELELEGKKAEREARLQELVPEYLKGAQPKEGYKRTPKDTTGMIQRMFAVEPPSPGESASVLRWCKLKPFLATSPQQVQQLIKHFGHKPGRNYKTGRATADEDTLKKLILKYGTSAAGEAYKLILEVRQLSKVLGTYVHGWKPGPDGRIHPTPGLWGKMFRVSYRRPNTSATIADKAEDQIASGFRKCVECAPGRVLIESDWKGMEAVLSGYFAGDYDYIRLARLGVHDYFGLSIIGDPPSLDLPDATLKQIFGEFKEKHPKLRDDAKHIVHGTAYGMTPPLMVALYDMSLKDAAKLQERYFTLFPKIRAWQLSTVRQAHAESRLTNPFGYPMWFWSVYEWNGRRNSTLKALWAKGEAGWAKAPKPTQEALQRALKAVQGGSTIEAAIRAQCYDLGDDAKSAISFLPRDTGAAMLKEVVLRLEHKYQLASRGYLINTTHDSVLTECPEAEADWTARVVREEMEAPVPELGGLWIRVDQKIGRAWKEKDKKDPTDTTGMVKYKPPSTETAALAASTTGAQAWQTSS